MRTFLSRGTRIRDPGGVIYQIIGDPVGEGGGSIIYPAEKYLPDKTGAYEKTPFLYAVKECYPLSADYIFVRDETGQILPDGETNSRIEQAQRCLEQAKKRQEDEKSVTGEIFHRAFRLTPVLETYQEEELSQGEDAPFRTVENGIAIMESLSEKGQSLKACLGEKTYLPADQAFRIILQVLYAVREVHDAGYLHLDLQDGNVFLKGQLEDGSGMISLIDFGAARKRIEDGFCAPVTDGALYSTPGFSAPEIRMKNDGTLRLGPQADLYSVGCLLLLLLTGHRFSGQELYENKTGRYIPRFLLRKTRCPRHLVEKMQQILARALENEPVRRYGSAQEMISEVSAFLELLTPRRNPLSLTGYDAFLCYRHGSPDTMAARELRNALEHYRGSALFGTRKIRRVFLDEGELSSCADFGERIRDALKNSEWLVVLCSENTRLSHWVNEEIRTFLEYHDVSHILAVVTEGEPKEVFPEELIKNGMDANILFAADARGEREKQIRKKIRGDVKLQIAAPILNTTYDALKQRNKIYEIKRAATAACVCFFALALFLGYVAVKSRTIARQAAAIVREHEAALKNQAMRLLEQAKISYAEHDPISAMEGALQAWSLQEEAGIFLPDTIYTLSRVMGIYTTPLGAEGTVTATGIFPVKGTGSFEPYFVTEDGAYLFTADRDEITIWDTETYQIAQTISAPWTLKEFDERCLVQSRSQFLELCSDRIACYDYGQEKEVWNYRWEEPITAVGISADQSMLAVTNAQNLYLMDAKEGMLLLQSPLSGALPADGEETLWKDPVICISPDNRRIAIAAWPQSASQKADPCSVFLYEAKKDRWAEIPQNDAGASAGQESFSSGDMMLHFTEDGQLIIVRSSGVNTVYTSNVTRYYSEKKHLNIQMYDPDKDQMLWQSEREYMSMGDEIRVLDPLFLVYADRCEKLDPATGEVLDALETDASIQNAWCGSEGITFVLENGSLLEHRYDTDRLEGWEYFPAQLSYCYPQGDCYFVRQQGGPIVRYQAGVYDEGYIRCDTAQANSLSRATEHSAQRAAMTEAPAKGGGMTTALPAEKESPVEEIAAKDTGLEYPAEGDWVSPDGSYEIVPEEDGFVIEKKEDSLRVNVSLGQRPLGAYWLEDSTRLLLGLSDRVVLYNARTGRWTETELLEHATMFLARWLAVDEEEVIYSGSSCSYALQLAGDEVSILFELKDFIAYNASEDALYFRSESFDMQRLDSGIYVEREEFGKIMRYPADEIVKKAKERLVDFDELT